MNKAADTFLDKLSEYNIKYAVVTGIYEQEGSLVEQKEINFVEDLDIVFFDIICESLRVTFRDIEVENIINNTYKYKTISDEVPIDIYIDYINVGYYYLFKINKEDTIDNNGTIRISESDYIIYQFLEPLIKFSEYKKRHKYRLQKYINNGYITPLIKEKLYAIIGKYCTEYILTSFQKNQTISRKFTKLLKLRLLIINNNFYRLLQKRVFKNDQCLY